MFDLFNTKKLKELEDKILELQSKHKDHEEKLIDVKVDVDDIYSKYHVEVRPLYKSINEIHDILSGEEASKTERKRLVKKLDLLNEEVNWIRALFYYKTPARGAYRELYRNRKVK